MTCGDREVCWQARRGASRLSPALPVSGEHEGCELRLGVTSASVMAPNKLTAPRWPLGPYNPVTLQAICSHSRKCPGNAEPLGLRGACRATGVQTGGIMPVGRVPQPPSAPERLLFSLKEPCLTAPLLTGCVMKGACNKPRTEAGTSPNPCSAPSPGVFGDPPPPPVPSL